MGGAGLLGLIALFALIGLGGGKAKAATRPPGAEPSPRPRPPPGGGGGGVPGGGAPGAPGDPGIDMLAEAFEACPDRDPEITAAAERYGAGSLASPSIALAQLRKELAAICPEVIPAADELSEEDAWALVDEARASEDPDRIEEIVEELADGGWPDLASDVQAALDAFNAAMGQESGDVADDARAALRFELAFQGLARLLEAEFDLMPPPTREQAEKILANGRGLRSPDDVGRVADTLFAWGFPDLANQAVAAINRFTLGMQADEGPEPAQHRDWLKSAGWPGLAASLEQFRDLV